MPIHTRREGAVAVLTLARPPVNALSLDLRGALWVALQDADADPAVRAIVLAGELRGFCAGGELAEMRTPQQQAWPGISDHLLPRIEACRKPVIAAMHGFAIGGGLELALACHLRVAARDTRIALPEIKHGVVPPSGSQRMPRAIGAEWSLAMIVSGDTAPANEFAGTGLFDVLCDPDEVIDAALACAAALDPAMPPAQRLLRHRPLDRIAGKYAIAAWRERLRGGLQASPAMHRCVDAVACAVHAPDFDSGLKAAKRLHDELALALRQPSLETQP
jgi:enoyl-CoA hydratase